MNRLTYNNKSLDLCLHFVFKVTEAIKRINVEQKSNLGSQVKKLYLQLFMEKHQNLKTKHHNLLQQNHFK